VALVGETEMQEQKVTLKNMESGDQSMLSIDQLIETLL
jgi:histidyl-tRNA synthetase